MQTHTFACKYIDKVHERPCNHFLWQIRHILPLVEHLLACRARNELWNRSMHWRNICTRMAHRMVLSADHPGTARSRMIAIEQPLNDWPLSG